MAFNWHKLRTVLRCESGGAMDKLLSQNNKTNVIRLNFRTNLLSNKALLATNSRRLQHIVASGALAMTLFMVTAINFAISSFQNETPSQARGIASIHDTKDSVVAKWDNSFLKKLANKNNRETASVSVAPTALDQLKFGLLEGKYAVKLEDGKVKEISFQEAINESDRPKYINSKESFLLEYRAALGTDFQIASQVEQKVQDGKIVEVYQLLGSKSDLVAKVKFVSDQFGRLLNLQVNQ